MQGRYPSLILFFFNDTATTEIYTLSLHDALPISAPGWPAAGASRGSAVRRTHRSRRRSPEPREVRGAPGRRPDRRDRSEEHTSELQSQSNLVCRLLLEKKKVSVYYFSL